MICRSRLKVHATCERGDQTSQTWLSHTACKLALRANCKNVTDQCPGPHPDSPGRGSQMGRTVDQPAASLGLQSAGFASVDTRSINTRTLSLRAISFPKRQKWSRTCLHDWSSLWSRPPPQLQSQWAKSNQRQRADLQTLTRQKQELDFDRPNLSRLRQPLLLERIRNNECELTWLAQRGSNKTPPILSGLDSLDLGSGVKPSLKITTSVSFARATSIERGGPTKMRLRHCETDSTNRRSKANSAAGGNFQYWSLEIGRRNARPIFPQSCEEPNINFPVSFPAADPGSQRPEQWSHRSPRSGPSSALPWSPAASPLGWRSPQGSWSPRELQLLLIKTCAAQPPMNRFCHSTSTWSWDCRLEPALITIEAKCR